MLRVLTGGKAVVVCCGWFLNALNGVLVWIKQVLGILRVENDTSGTSSWLSAVLTREIRYFAICAIIETKERHGGTPVVLHTPSSPGFRPRL